MRQPDDILKFRVNIIFALVAISTLAIGFVGLKLNNIEDRLSKIEVKLSKVKTIIYNKDFRKDV